MHPRVSLLCNVPLVVLDTKYKLRSHSEVLVHLADTAEHLAQLALLGWVHWFPRVAQKC